MTDLTEDEKAHLVEHALGTRELVTHLPYAVEFHRNDLNAGARAHIVPTLRTLTDDQLLVVWEPLCGGGGYGPLYADNPNLVTCKRCHRKYDKDPKAYRYPGFPNRSVIRY